MKKRTICLLLAMIMVLSIVLAGCSKTAETPAADETPATTELAEKLGLPVVPANSGEYTRGNAVDVIWALLETKFKSGGKTLAQTLIKKGVFTERLTEKRWERIAPISARFFPF